MIFSYAIRGTRGFCVALLVLLAIGTGTARAAEELPWRNRAPTLALPVPVDRLLPAPGGRLVGISPEENALVVVDVATLKVLDPIPLPARPLQLAVSPNPYLEEYVVLMAAEGETRIAYITGLEGKYQVQTISNPTLTEDFVDPHISFIDLPQTRAVESGPTLAISDLAGERGAGYYRLLYPGSFEFVKPVAFPYRLIDVGAGDAVLTLLPRQEQVALIDLRNGILSDSIFVDGIAFETAEALAITTVPSDTGTTKVTVVANADQGVLTLLGLREGRVTRLSAPLQIGFDRLDAGKTRAGRTLLVADRELTQILIGADGTDRVQLFRRIRGGLEFLEVIRLDEPIRDMTIFSIEQGAGPQVIAYLGDDGRTVRLRGLGDIPRWVDPNPLDGSGIAGLALNAAEIVRLQRQLQGLGFEIQVDGMLGPQSQSVISAFQRSVGLDETGLPDRRTVREIALASSGEAMQSATATIQRGDILQVQRLLAWLDYRVGAIDGEPGPQTEAALRAFQSSNGLDATGTIDDPTLEALTEAIASIRNSPETEEDLAAYVKFMSDRAVQSVRPERLLTLSASHEDPGHECFGLNYAPPRQLWENSVSLAHTLTLLEARLGQDLQIVSGFRSPAFERCHGEKFSSRHGVFGAMDLRVEGATSASDSAEVILAGLDDLVSAGKITAEVTAIGTFVHVEPQIGLWHTVIASHQLDDLGCAYARDDVDEAARLLAGSAASGRQVQVVRTGGGGGDVYAVTIDHHTDAAAAEVTKDLVRGVADRTDDGKTGADAFTMQRRGTTRLDANCRRLRVIP